MTNPEKNIELRGSAITNVGQVRSHNEDNIHLWTGEDVLLAIVADGMGGAAAGEEASRIAVETIMDSLSLGAPPTTPLPDIPAEELSSAVQAANLSIMQEAVDHPRQRGMGTTLTMVYVHGNTARFAHVGDSRAYRVNIYGEIEQITSDHSFVQALLDAGHITEEQAETHPMNNVLYRALGQTHDLDVDTYHAQLNLGDKLVLCSDGLTRHVRTVEIAELTTQEDDPDTLTSNLVALANERGGEDNISVIAIVVGSQQELDDLRADAKAKAPIITEPVPDDEDTMILKRDERIVSPADPTEPPAGQDPEARLHVRESSEPNHHHVDHSLAHTGRYAPVDAEGEDQTHPR